MERIKQPFGMVCVCGQGERGKEEERDGRRGGGRERGREKEEERDGRRERGVRERGRRRKKERRGEREREGEGETRKRKSVIYYITCSREVHALPCSPLWVLQLLSMQKLTLK